ARVAVPAWAPRADGADGVAVRAIVRIPRPARVERPAGDVPSPAAPLDEERLTALSRAVNAAPNADARAKALAERAAALAAMGAATAANEDARAAGVEVRARRSAHAALVPSDRAFGLDPDFDPAATRCSD